ncbi:putative succinyl-CoA:3-ketoacid-coenzyme A transferase, mitochondrial precursor [Fusarium austroafricanum]|uniref:Putative succinyl-CoA:3-ketoacid-coenzyme A transferase, mitochondrial n=1 Tax=Fusarium austroafricanum TaxID=2364996 RepID=A0A8H4PC30_9HYPO|nr:putative succinyl-CoA:3-ketoacid-coenzyme A transferase, mitochondrial precursor [Fusarium austroafricanum]
MADRKAVRIAYQGIEAWEISRDKVRELIADDTGADIWPETKSLPPFGMPPSPLSQECIQKLRALEGVTISGDEDD